MSNYRKYVEELTGSVKYLSAHYGSRLRGTFGLLTDVASEGIRYGFLSRLWAHPELPEDTLDKQGEALGLFRYRDEAASLWRARIDRVWDSYQEAGTSIGLAREIEAWGQALYGWDSSVTNVTIVERSPVWYKFEINIPDGRLPWTNGEPWGSFTWGDGTLWGVGSADKEDVASFIRLIRKWKRKSMIAVITIINGAYTVTFEVKS